jgi:hypothetical protein
MLASNPKTQNNGAELIISVKFEACLREQPRALLEDHLLHSYVIADQTTADMPDLVMTWSVGSTIIRLLHICIH